MPIHALHMQKSRLEGLCITEKIVGGAVRQSNLTMLARGRKDTFEESCIITLQLLIREYKSLSNINKRRFEKSIISAMMETRQACLCWRIEEVPGT